MSGKNAFQLLGDSDDEDDTQTTPAVKSSGPAKTPAAPAGGERGAGAGKERKARNATGTKGGKGGKGGAPRAGKREFDRKSGTGRRDTEKRGGAGKANWGSAEDQMKESQVKANGASEAAAYQAPEEEEEEPEEPTRDYDEVAAEREAARAAMNAKYGSTQVREVAEEVEGFTIATGDNDLEWGVGKEEVLKKKNKSRAGKAMIDWNTGPRRRQEDDGERREGGKGGKGGKGSKGGKGAKGSKGAKGGKGGKGFAGGRGGFSTSDSPNLANNLDFPSLG